MTFSIDWVLNIKESVKMHWPQLVSEPRKSTPLLVSEPLKSNQILSLNWSMVPEVTENTRLEESQCWVYYQLGDLAKNKQLWNKVGTASNMEKDDNTIIHACMHTHVCTHAYMHARTHAHTHMHTHTTGIIQVLMNYAKQAKFLVCCCVHYHCNLKLLVHCQVK